MTTTIDASGNVAIPSELREMAGLEPGTPVEITYRAGHLEIEPAPAPMRLEKRGRLTVLVPEEPITEPMTDEQLLEFIDEFRNGKWD